MKYFVFLFILPGCVTKTICTNSNQSFRPVYDVKRNCKVRIENVIVGSELKLPRAVSLNSQKISWSYKWNETQLKNGVVEFGHFILVPATKENTSL